MDNVGIKMDKTEFIAKYAETAGLENYITNFGIAVFDRYVIAIPCECGETLCTGWQMRPLKELQETQTNLTQIQAEIAAWKNDN